MSGQATPVQGPHAARSLAELTAGIVAAPPDLAVSDVTLDSRAVRPGALFLAFRGRKHHGLEFASEAIARGASAILYETPAGAGALHRSAGAAPVFVAGVPHLAAQAGTIADRFFGAPSRALTLAGITGTNGKTTCAYLLAQALNACGRRAAYSGTIGIGVPGALQSASHTTPDVVTLHRQLAELRALGAECVALEVSSHALDQSRVAGVRFHTAAFTNLTRDHLDYHGTMAAYGEAKARLLAWPGLACRIVNVDDAFGSELAARASAARTIVTARRVRPRRAEYVYAQALQLSSAGLVIEIDSSWGSADCAVPLVGEFNADNVLTVLAVLLAWEIPLESAVQALATCAAPPGRMEACGGRDGQPLAIVDYAHTPDALEKALRAARAHCRGRLRVVFGCGGERDPGKRAPMGRIARELADEVILTDDNPRGEDPARIVADVLSGIDDARAVIVEHDRAAAIERALRASDAADVVLIAGKGHEDYQITAAGRRPFRDQAVVRAALAGEHA